MLMKPKWPADAFEQWWQHYPRRVAKKFALKCFERLRKSGEVPFEVLLSATKNYAKSRIGKEMQFTLHPATWLNGGNWDNDEAALLDGKVKPTSLPLVNGKVLITRNSPQALAWERHRGRSFPWGASGVWAVDSEYPLSAALWRGHPDEDHE